MTRARLIVVASVLAVLGTASQAYARRGIPIPIVWGSGEKMTDLGELPPEVSEALAEELGGTVNVAFLNERAHVFYCDLWTWNGRHVVRSGDSYWEPDADAWQQLIEGDPSSKYGTPILYRFPLLPTLIVVVIAGVVIRKRFFKTEEEKLEALMNDARYQKAVESIFGTDGDEESDVMVTTLDDQKFMAAKNQLIADGVAADVADKNLRKLTDAILLNTNAQIDAYLELASQLDEQEEWDKSAEVYTQVIASLPDGDERKARAQERLASVNEKRPADAAAEDDAEEGDVREPE